MSCILILEEGRDGFNNHEIYLGLQYNYYFLRGHIGKKKYLLHLF